MSIWGGFARMGGWRRLCMIAMVAMLIGSLVSPVDAQDGDGSGPADPAAPVEAAVSDEVVPYDDGRLVIGPGADEIAEDGTMAPVSPGEVEVDPAIRRGRDTTTAGPSQTTASVAAAGRITFAADGVAVATSHSAEAGAVLAGGVRLTRSASGTVEVVALDSVPVAGSFFSFTLDVAGSIEGAPLAAASPDDFGAVADVDLGVASGSALEFDLELFADALSDPTGVEFLVGRGCSGSAGCASVQELPSIVDVEAGVARVELPTNVLASFSDLEAGPAQAQDDFFNDKPVPVPQEPDTVILITQATSSDTGNYRATPYGSLASWQVGVQTGHAETSYTIPVPDGDGHVPDVTFHYSSGAVDGMNRATNNQPSTVGVGWTPPTAVVTRDVISCFSGSTNLCPSSGNRHDGFDIAFGGVSSPLVRLTGDSGTAHPQVSGATYWSYVLQQKNDWRIWRVEQPSKWGTGSSNGDRWTTWWEITTGDGTLHVFGRERAFKPSGGSGVATTRPRTTTSPVLQSALVVPVWFDDADRSGANCDSDPSLDGFCDTAIAWHLDHVIDTSGNLAVYHYQTETNRFRPYVNGELYPSTRQYDRAIQLDRIDYSRKFSQTPLNAGQKSPYRVDFSYANRTDSSGGYPDTPTNLKCSSTSSCTEREASFFTERRLSGIGVYVNGVWKYGFGLRHSFPQAPGEGGYSPTKKSLPKLWLDSIERWGLPRTEFTPTFLANRVNFPGDVSPMRMARIEDITTETGATVTFTYDQSHPPNTISGHECNKLRTDRGIRRLCDMYPAFDAFTSGQGPVWWNKWKVTRQDVSPREGGSAIMTTRYEYPVAPDWAHAPIGSNTTGYWNDYRGHRRVDVIDGEQAKTTHYFVTGMYDDRYGYGGNPGQLLGQATSAEPATTRDPRNNVVDNRFAINGRTLGQIGSTKQPYVVRAKDTVELAHKVEHQFSRSGVPARYLTSYRLEQRRTISQHYDNPQTGAFDVARTTTDYDWLGRAFRLRDLGLDGTTADDRTEYRTFVGWGWYPSLPLFVGTRAGNTGSTNTTSGFIAAQQFQYDGFGRPVNHKVQYRQAGNGQPLWRETAMTYDNRGRLKTEKALGASGTGDDQQTTYSYNDQYGYLKQVDGPLSGTVDRYSYKVDPAWGAATEITDPNNRKTKLKYDGQGRLSEVTFPGSNTVNRKYSYGLSNAGVDWVKTEELRSRTGSDRYIPMWEFFDGLGRLIQTQSWHPTANNQANVVSMNYDGLGRPLTTTEPAWRSRAPGQFRWENWGSIGVPITRYEYPRSLSVDQGCSTGVNTLTRYIDGGGAQWESEKSARCGLESRSWNTDGERVTRFSDARGNTTRTVDTHGAVTTFLYSARGDLTRVTDHVGNQTRYEFWSQEQSGPSRIIDPDRGQTTYTYDGHGRVYESVDARGIRLRNTYDKADRMTRVQYHSPSGLRDVSKWTYDRSGARGLLRKAESWNRDQSGGSRGYVSDEFWYDSQGRNNRITRKIDNGTRTTRFTHTDSGLVKRVTHPNGKWVERGYNRLDLPNWVKYQGTNVVNYTNYNARNQIAEVRRGSPGTQQTLTTTYGYDNKSGWLASATTRRDSTQVLRYDYHYTPEGLVRRIAETGQGAQTSCFLYDANNRLKRGWTRTDGNCGNTTTNNAGPEPYRVDYDYNPIGNITNATGPGTVGGGYAYASGHPHAPSQAGGNFYSYDAAGNRAGSTVNGQFTSYTHDVQQRLIATSGSVSSTMLYTTGGERAKRTVNGSAVWYSPAGFEVNGAGKVTLSILHGGVLAATVDGSNKIWSQVTDHLGSPVYARSQTGAVELRRHLPFGGPRSPGSAVLGVPSDLGFTGQRDDGVLGLLYYGARYYDSMLGQFVQPDVVVPDAGRSIDWNRYAYVRNDPLNQVDPSGNCSLSSGARIEGLGRQSCATGHYYDVPFDGPQAERRQGLASFVAHHSSFAGKPVPEPQPDPRVSTAVSLFIDVSPAWGDIKGVYEAATGRNAITGEPIGMVDRALGAAFFTEGRLLRSAWGAAVARNTSRGTSHASDLVDGPIWSTTKKGSRAENALRHFHEHGHDFSDVQNAIEYVAKAQDFLRTPPGATLTRVRSNGDVVRYHPGSNTFGVMDATGAPRTFFRPDPAIHGYATNMDYFYAQ